jgi:hypothetical protein
LALVFHYFEPSIRKKRTHSTCGIRKQQYPTYKPPENPGAELAAALGDETYLMGQDTLLKKGKPSLVLGPILIDDLHLLAQKKLISPQDFIIRSFDRWKSVAVVFPDLRSAFGTLDDTSDTSTSSIAGTGFTETPTPDTVELDEVDQETTAVHTMAHDAVDQGPQLFTLQVEEPDEVVLPIQD